MFFAFSKLHIDPVTFFAQVGKNGGVTVHAFISVADPFLLGPGIVKGGNVNIQGNQLPQAGGKTHF